MLKGAKAYVSTQVTTTTQGDLLIMLYDAAIKFLNQAKVEMDNRDYAKKGILISRAIDIIAELSSSLNKEKGGALASNLNAIYLFSTTQLAKANLRMDKSMIDEVIGLLTPIREAYAQIVPQYDKPLANAPSVGSSSAPAPGPAPGAGAAPPNLSRAGAYAAQAIKSQAGQPAPGAPSQPTAKKPAPQVQQPEAKSPAPAAQAAAPQQPQPGQTQPPQPRPAQPQQPPAETGPESEATAAQPGTPASAAANAADEKKNGKAASEQEKAKAEEKPKTPPQPSLTLNAARIRAANAYGNSR